MFLVPTYVKSSPIHGRGVYTPAPIEAGTRLWQLEPESDWIIEREVMAQFPEPYRSRLLAFCYTDDADRYVLCGDNARFMNHSDDPNCDDTGQHFTIARRDIAAHEELTCDYRDFDAESASKKEALQFEHVYPAEATEQP